MIVASRIDSRLIHGQVIEAWLPHLRVARVVVADDRTAADSMAQAAMALAVPEAVEVVHSPIAQLDLAHLRSDSVRTLLLFRDVSSALAARERGLPDGRLVLGNVHSGPGREQLSRSVFLTNDEQRQLSQLTTSGMEVVLQAVPSDAAIAFPHAAS